MHLTVDGASHAKAFAGIGEALASFLAAAARPRAKSGDLCTESNKDYRKLCGTVRSLCDTLRSQMTTKGFAAAMLRCALERSDAAAGALVSKRLGGKLDSDVSDVRKSGMVNRHAGDAQLRLAERALDAALGAKYVTNFIEKFGTMLEKIGSTDQLMNGVLLKQPATDPGTDPGGPRAPGGEPAAPQGGPAPGAATQPAAPAVFNNHNENNVNLNLDGLGKPFDEFVRMMGALLTRMDAFDPSRVQRPSDTDGPAHGPTGVRATVVKSPPSFVQTLNVAPADASTEPPVDPQQSSSAMVVRSVGTDAPPKAGELEKMPTGAWRLDGSAWKMVRANPIVRTTEGPRRIDPFSGVGAHVMRGAGVDGVPPGAGSHLAKTDPSVATGASSADASTEVDGNRHGGQQSGLQTALQTDGLEAGSQTESRQVSADRSHRDAQVQTASEPPVDPQQSSPAMADRSVGTAEPPKVDELENKQVGGWQRIRREIDGKIRYEWVKDGENPFVRTTDGPHRMNERSNIGWPKSGVGSRPANTDSIDKGAK
ncbi:hypothetical protein [Burkholderia oklahomensis]|uniref:hypothetical protein n=1 Tax=Burkholderia oklahomensis TaxID=342113 RepID=UPI003F51150C